MNIQTTANNIELTPEINSYLDKRFSVIDKLVRESDQVHARVVLSKETNHHRHGDIYLAEINMFINGENIFAKTEQESLYAAIDILKDEVSAQLRNRKDKKETLFIRGHRTVKKMLEGLKF